jgi:hypothetical protein
MSWTLSQYGLYQKCPLAFKYRHKDRLSSPPGPAAARGSGLHDSLEGYLKTGDWGVTIPLYARHRAEAMRDDGFMAEERWAFNDKWEPELWDSPNVWVRGIVDAVLEDTPWLHIGEWKSGKVWEDHGLQRDIYLVMGLCTYTKSDEAHIATIYIDQGFDVTAKLERKDLEAKKIEWTKRVEPMLNDTFFSPRPGQHCNWCSFSNRKGGPCVY